MSMPMNFASFVLRTLLQITFDVVRLAVLAVSSPPTYSSSSTYAMEYEKQFNISIPDDKAEGIQTVGDAINYITENAK